MMGDVVVWIVRVVWNGCVGTPALSSLSNIAIGDCYILGGPGGKFSFAIGFF